MAPNHAGRKPLMRSLTFFSKSKNGKEPKDDVVESGNLKRKGAGKRLPTFIGISPPDTAPDHTSLTADHTLSEGAPCPAPPEVSKRSKIGRGNSNESANISLIESVDSDGEESVGSHDSVNRAILCLDSGDEYEGFFKHGAMHGLGVLRHVDGRVYKGDFVDSRKQGMGITIFSNGDKHIGQYCDNQMSGRGTFIFARGHKYVGELEMDKFHGVGTLTYPDGEVFYGTFFNGVKVAGSYILPSGDIRRLENRR